MCANAGPAEYNYEETISTLRYANRAKNIKNKPKINEDPKDAMLREYQDEISRLKAQLMGMGGEGGIVILDGKEVDISKIGGGISEDALKEMQEKADKEKDEIRARAERDMEKLLDQQKGTEEEVSSTFVYPTGMAAIAPRTACSSSPRAGTRRRSATSCSGFPTSIL